MANASLVSALAVLAVGVRVSFTFGMARSASASPCLVDPNMAKGRANATTQTIRIRARMKLALEFTLDTPLWPEAQIDQGAGLVCATMLPQLHYLTMCTFFVYQSKPAS